MVIPSDIYVGKEEMVMSKTKKTTKKAAKTPKKTQKKTPVAKAKTASQPSA